MTSPARSAGKAVFRGWGTLTADLRPPPDFLLIGTKRGGTTSLSRYLFAHPDVAPLFPRLAAPKGVRYFDEHAERSERWYRSHFATVITRGSVYRPRKLAGEATANYLFHPVGAERARRAAPDAKVLVLVRDPVERAWSHWREGTRSGSETLGFEDALAAEGDRLRSARERWGEDRGDLRDVGANLAYRAQGIYADLLPAWLERFGDRVLVLVSEEMFADPAGAYGRVVEFLGLRPHDLGTYEAANYRTPGQSMDPRTRADLVAFFAEHSRRLESLMGRSLPWSHRAGGDASTGNDGAPPVR
jgi:Sulfotransferase domain